MDPWVLFKHRLNTALYMSIVADHFHAFSHNTHCHKAKIGFLYTIMCLLYSNAPKSPDPMCFSLGFGADRSAATVWCCHVKYGPNLWGVFSSTLLNKDLRQFWRKIGAWPWYYWGVSNKVADACICDAYNLFWMFLLLSLKSDVQDTSPDIPNFFKSKKWINVLPL